MADTTTQTAGANLPFSDAVPGAVTEVTKNGLVVAPDKLLDLATYLRDQQGYDYLSMVTSVDWPQHLEVVYYLSGVAKPQTPLVLKVRLPDKANPELPSVTHIWPGADLQEREVYDMMGIRFTGHPNLRRILLWDGFEGWPLRKDYKESYYEEDAKPFKSRHPDGNHQWAEDRVPWKDNTSYPVAWDPDLFTQPTVQYRKIMAVDPAGNGGGEFKSDRILVNMGPQHPSTHRRLSHGGGGRWRKCRRTGAGDRLFASLP